MVSQRKRNEAARILINKMEKYRELIDKLKKYRTFKNERLEKSDLACFEELSKLARLDILKMTTIAGTGHLGGSFSTIDLYILLWLCADINKQKIEVSDEERDIIIISIGHTSAAAYVALGINGFIDLEDAINNFRTGSSIFEGHLSNMVPGIEWSSGDLGQGLSVGCGYALALKKKKINNRVFVVMGDGEQQKGQIAEAIRFANKYDLDNLIAIVDNNRFQATNSIDNIMPNDIEGNYTNGGWNVVRTDGHGFSQLYRTLRDSYFNSSNKPNCIIAKTRMCNGLEGFEDDYEYHGNCLTDIQYDEAIRKFDLAPELLEYYLDIEKDSIKENRKNFTARYGKVYRNKRPGEKNIEKSMNVSFQKEFQAGQMIANRDAFGDALVRIGRDNVSDNDHLPVLVLDCDLKGSVKTDRFEKNFPENFIQAGIAEHNAVAVAGAISKCGMLTFFADFGVFAIDEVYNQLRLNDINDTSVKIACTHNGIEVGEDGKTHHCLDYISLISNLFNFKIIIPADANHTIHATNYIAAAPGNFLLVLNRSKIPVIAGKDGKPLFGKVYTFDYGKSDWLRIGTEGTIITCGHMAFRALEAAGILEDKHDLNIGVLSVSSLPQLDTDKLIGAIKDTKNIIVYEDHNINTGLGTIIGSFIAEKKLSCNFKKMGVSRYGVSSGTGFQYEYQGLGVDDLVANFLSMMDL
jgi:transketolase